jgi:pantoate--beta-alanine ligase
MRIITTASEMVAFATAQKAEGATIGFVPTMGELHDGHASLMRAARQDNDIVVASVFVNPTQFDQVSDLEKYPRTFDSDKALLKKESVDIMFFPSVSEMYPDPTMPSYEMDGLDEGMEGANRPGHFNGVVQVVTRLFELVKPSTAYFGEKDFQQLAIIRHMTNKLEYPIDIVGCPTLREGDGLAMSSRNTRLTPHGRIIANQISKTLILAKTYLAQGKSLNKLIKAAKTDLTANPDIKLEYLELVYPNTLKSACDEDSNIQACIAVWIDSVRLIDNMRVKG